MNLAPLPRILAARSQGIPPLGQQTLLQFDSKAVATVTARQLQRFGRNSAATVVLRQAFPSASSRRTRQSGVCGSHTHPAFAVPLILSIRPCSAVALFDRPHSERGTRSSVRSKAIVSVSVCTELSANARSPPGSAVLLVPLLLRTLRLGRAARGLLLCCRMSSSFSTGSRMWAERLRSPTV